MDYNLSDYAFYESFYTIYIESPSNLIWNFEDIWATYISGGEL